MLPLAFLIVRGRFGRALRAVRDSEIASTANGVSTAALKTAAFGISAFYCGVAGALFGIGITYVNPDTFPIELSILLLVGIVIGGAGSIYGMLFGAVFVEFIQISWAGDPRADLAHPPHQHAGAGIGPGGLRRGPARRPLRRSPPGAAGLIRRVLLFRPLASYSRAASAVPPGHSAQGEEDA